MHIQLKKDKKALILAAALDLFAERGYHGTPVSLIAERARVGSGTIYRYFRDKDHLVNVLYRHWKRKYFDDMRHIDLDQPMRPLFRELCLRMVEFAETHRNAFIFLEAHHHSAYLDQASVDLSEQLKEPILEVLRKGQAQEMIKPGPPEILFAAIFGIFAETLKTYWTQGRQIPGEVVAQIEEMAWQAIRF